MRKGFGLQMDVALVYPPFADPRAPQLALPSLAAFLRPRGVSVRLFDLNVEAFEDLVSPERGDEIVGALRRKAAVNGDPAIRRALRLAETLGGEPAAAALADLRSPERFNDPGIFAAARGVVSSLLFGASTASKRARCGLAPLHYDVAGSDPARLADLLALTPDDDLFNACTERLIAKLRARPPDLVGVTITNRQQIAPGLLLARRLTAIGLDVVLGGAVLTKFADALVRSPAFFATFAPFVVLFEGETALLALIEARAAGVDLATVPNLLHLRDGAVFAGPTHVEDVAELPTPDFTGLPLDRYLSPEPVLPILTGKGCYFNRCKFCDIPFINSVSRKAYRVRPPERVVDDVHVLHARHNARAFVITDEALSPRLLNRLADAFDDRPGDFGFTGYARLEPGFDPTTCRRIAAFGMKKLFFGLESANQTESAQWETGVRRDAAPQILRNCRDAGVDFHLFSMVGLPEESRAQAEETVDFLISEREVIEAPGSSFDVHPFGLELRTPYFENRESFGIEVADGVLDREFVIGLSGAEWRNTRGLSGAEVDRLISNTFAPRLRATFRDWHAGPDPLWPPQEEYAVLYALSRPDGEMDWRTALPETDEAFVFVLDDRCPLSTTPTGVALVHPRAEILLEFKLLGMLTSEAARTWTDHLSAWDLREADVRAAIEGLIAFGLLRLRLAGPAVTDSPSRQCGAAP